jgi:hypothetical protein
MEEEGISASWQHMTRSYVGKSSVTKRQKKDGLLKEIVVA